jgi:hypothetical protein
VQGDGFRERQRDIQRDKEKNKNKRVSFLVSFMCVRKWFSSLSGILLIPQQKLVANSHVDLSSLYGSVNAKLDVERDSGSETKVELLFRCANNIAQRATRVS